MPAATPLGIIRRVVSWTCLAVLVVTLVLILKQSPAPSVATDPAAAASAENKLETAGQEAASGQPAQVQLDSTELNSYLAQNLQLAGSDPASAADAANSAATRPGDSSTPAVAGADPQTVEEAQSSVKDVKVDIDGDLVKTYVVFDFHGKDLSLELEGHLGTQDGYLNFEPVGGKLGSFPLPQSALESAVQKMMDSPENREKLRLPADISDVEVENGQVVVSYK
jgi:hypothetical protein